MCVCQQNSSSPASCGEKIESAQSESVEQGDNYTCTCKSSGLSNGSIDVVIIGLHNPTEAPSNKRNIPHLIVLPHRLSVLTEHFLLNKLYYEFFIISQQLQLLLRRVSASEDNFHLLLASVFVSVSRLQACRRSFPEEPLDRLVSRARFNYTNVPSTLCHRR